MELLKNRLRERRAGTDGGAPKYWEKVDSSHNYVPCLVCNATWCPRNFPEIVESVMQSCYYGAQVDQECLRKSVNAYRIALCKAKWEI